MRSPRPWGTRSTRKHPAAQAVSIGLLAVLALATATQAAGGPAADDKPKAPPAASSPPGDEAAAARDTGAEEKDARGDDSAATKVEAPWLDARGHGPRLILSPFLESLRLGGQIRVRGEARDPVNYSLKGDPERGADFALLRTRIDLEATVNDHLSGFLEIQDSRQFGQDPNLMPTGGTSVLSDVEGTDLHQGFVRLRNIGNLPIGTEIQAGRFALSYGDQRLISPLDWDNVSRAWDGVRARVTAAPIRADFFATVIKEASPGGTIDDDQSLFGTYLSYDGKDGLEVDTYWFYRNFKDGMYTHPALGLTGDLEDSTVGIRAAYGEPEAGLPFHTTAELMFQRGNRVGLDVAAYAFAGTFDWILGGPWKAGTGVEYTYASGDDDPTDREDHSFDPLFPFGHSYQGWADLVGFRNSHDFVGKLYASPIPGWTLGTNLHYFRLDENEDAWYTPAITSMRPGSPAADTSLGYEVDVYAKTKIDEALALFFGYSHFFPGAFVRQTGSDPGLDWAFVMATLNL